MSCRKVKNLFIHEPTTVGHYPLKGSVVLCGSSPPSHEHHGSTLNRSGIFKYVVIVGIGV